MEFDARIPNLDKYVHNANYKATIGTATMNEDGTVHFVLDPTEENKALFDLIQKDTLKGVSLYGEGDPMDDLVYFGVSFHCIPLSTADEIRKLLMQIPDLGRYNFDYSNPIIQEEEI